jgi:hypothetical protein
METEVLRLLQVYNGPPDLAVIRVAAPRGVVVGEKIGGVQDSTLVIVTIQNRFSPPPQPFAVQGNTWPVFGSDARNVLVMVTLTNGLYQIGNFVLPPGFQAAISPDRKSIFFLGGTIAAGASVDFQFEVAGESVDPVCYYPASILVEADPFSYLVEADKTNNRGSGTIFVVRFC